MYLNRLVYYCSNKIRDLGLPLAPELKAIIAAGHKNNPAAGITGALIFNERYFVGVFEGERRLISTALLRIAADRRAGDLVVMAAGPIDQRRFDDWLSCYAGHSDAIDRIYLRYGLVQGLDPSRMSAESTVGMAEALSRLDARALANATAGNGHEPVEVIKVTPVLSGMGRRHDAPV